MSEDEEQSPGGRTLRMGKKKEKDGPNWFMIAGGAVVMAVSVAFGRKRILSEGDKTKERAPNDGTRSQAASHDVDETGSVHTDEMVHSGTPLWDEPESELRSFTTKRPAPSDPSPQVSKVCRQLSHSSVCQSNKNPVQSDSHSSTAILAGLSARREMVHRLRQQIRSRDGMIYDMQAQLADQERMISMHLNHSADLQECVQTVSAKLFEANMEVQRLHRELMAQRAKPMADLDEECIDIAVAEIKRRWVHPKDVEDIILEARRLNEEVERLEREKVVKNNLAQAKSRQCELLSKKVSSLATELEEANIAAHGKQRLLKAKEQENLKLASVLQDLQHKLQIESRDDEWTRSSKLVRRTDALHMNSSWKLNHNVDRPVTPTDEEVSSAYVGDGHNNYHQAGSLSLGKPYASVHARNGSQQDSEESVAKVDSWCLSDAHTKRLEAEATSEQDNGNIDEGLILKLENEVDQIASGLSVTSKVISEKMQATTRVLMKFQEHCKPRTDVQSNAKGFNFLQVFDCLSESMSAEQRQEVRNDLEQAAKQQDVEREMEVLTEHQAKLEELKYAVAKASSRFNAQNTEDDSFNAGVLQLASSLSDLEQRLAVQDDIVKESSSFLKQLSTLFRASSPQSPPIQEIWKTVNETSGNTPSVNGHQQFIGSSDENSRNAVQSRAEEKASRILERQDSSSWSLQYVNPSRDIAEKPSSSPVKLLDKPYQFQLGASDGPSRTRSRNPLGAARVTFRKPATNHDSMVGSKRLSVCVGGSARDRGSFGSDSEVTSGFSFGFSARDRPLNNVGKSTSGGYQLEAIVESALPYEQEQGNRMSSPEPEPNPNLFRTSPSFNTSDLSVGNPTFSKRFRTQTGSESLSPAYDVRSSASARFGSPDSPCFGVPRDEPNCKRPMFAVTSSPLVTSSTSDPRGLHFVHSDDSDFQIKWSTEENSSRASNADCSPRLLDVTPVGVYPFAARMAYLDVGSPVGSLRNFEVRSERDHGFAPSNEDESEEEVSNHRVYSRITLSTEDQQSHLDRDLEPKDSCGSCHPEEPLTFFPSLLLRSSSSNRQPPTVHSGNHS